MRQFESRLQNAQKRAKPRPGAVYRCYISDGQILYLTPMEIMKHYASLDEDFAAYDEPYIYRLECATGRDRDRKLCEVVEQLIEDTAEKIERGERHRP